MQCNNSNFSMGGWTKSQIDFLTSFYPEKGKMWCATVLKKTESSVRHKAAQLGLKLNKESDFFKEFQARAAQSKVGKKRPAQAEVMNRTRAEGKFVFTQERRKAISDRQTKIIKENGHPKGALGLKHSKETKEKISIVSKKMWANMSEEEKNKRSERASKLGQKHSAENRIGKTTWKAGWREIGGVRKYYRSRWEANYARYLEWLCINGQIKDWKHEPKVFWFEKIQRGTRSYLPDFWVLTNNDQDEYHEVKGWMDDRSKTKIKRMGIYHPLIKLVVIDSKQYKELEKKMSNIIKDWEHKLLSAPESSEL